METMTQEVQPTNPTKLKRPPKAKRAKPRRKRKTWTAERVEKLLELSHDAIPIEELATNPDDERTDDDLLAAVGKSTASVEQMAIEQEYAEDIARLGKLFKRFRQKECKGCGKKLDGGEGLLSLKQLVVYCDDCAPLEVVLRAPDTIKKSPKQVAIDLKRKGVPLSQIVKIVGRPYSTVARWVEPSRSD